MSFKTEAYAYTSTYYAENDRGECEFDLLGERVKNWNLDDNAEAYVNGQNFDRMPAACRGSSSAGIPNLRRWIVTKTRNSPSSI